MFLLIFGNIKTKPMNNIRFTFLFVSLFATILFTAPVAIAGWVIKSGNVKVKSGTTVKVTGDLEVRTGATLSNAGEVILDGDLANDGTPSLGTGSYEITGTATHQISGSATSEFADLTLSTETGLAAGILVSNTLNLNTASLLVNDWDATISNTGSITGYDASHYIVTNGSGSLVMEVGASGSEFPIGHTSSYLPVNLVNNGTVDNFKTRVFNDVLDGGTTGTTIPEIDHAVNATWVIEEEVSGGSDLDVTLNWSALDEGTNFDRNYCGIGHYHNSGWDGQNASPAAGTGPYSKTRSGVTDLSAFAVGDLMSPLALGLRLDVTAFLQGPFNGTDMTNYLNIAGYIPLNHPYSGSPWNYTGTESVASMPGTDIIDWVLVELRDASSAANADGTTMIARQAALLRSDGVIVATDGSSDLLFHTTYSQNLYALVWHRNHLGIMSNNALTASGGVYTYDFSTGSDQVYGGINGHKQIGTGIWGMVGGDGNADSQINNGDKNDVWAVEAGTAGYKAGDFNMDVNVNNGDKNDILLPNAGMGGQVPDNGYQCQIPE